MPTERPLEPEIASITSANRALGLAIARIFSDAFCIQGFVTQVTP